MADSKPSTSSQASPSAPETYTVDGVIYSVHPLASLFPLLKGVAYDEFLSDVVRRGIAKPYSVAVPRLSTAGIAFVRLPTLERRSPGWSCPISSTLPPRL